MSPVVYIYDPNGHLTGIRDAKGKEISIEDDTNGRIETTTDRSGNTTIMQYNERGNVTWVQNALGQTTIYEYNDPNFGKPGEAGYEPRNPDKATAVKVPLVANADPNIESQWSITRTTYDDEGRILTVTDPEGNLAENSYGNDIYGNLLTVAHKKPDGSEVSTTRNTYIANLLKTTRVTQGADTNIFAMTVNLYDGYNRLTNVINVDLAYIGNVNALYTLDGIGNLENAGKHAITSYEYNEAESGSFDQPYKVTDAAGFERFFEYDDNGALIETRTYTDPASPPATPRQAVWTVYDAAGRVLRTRRQINGGQTTELGQTIYNAIGRVDESVNEVGTSTVYEYDEMGNLVETLVYDTDPASPGATPRQAARTLYDAAGRVLVTVDAHEPNVPANGSENLYDELGRIIMTRRWANVDVNLVDLDVNGVKVGLKVPDRVEPNNAQVSGGDLNIGWTSGGVLPRVNTANMLSYTRTEYDVGGRVQMTVDVNEAGYERPTSYEYDKAGKQTAVIDPNGHDVVYVNSGSWHVITGYSLNGRQRTETEYRGTQRWKVTDARNNMRQFEYDVLGRLVKTMFPATSQNPVTYVHTHYDSLGRKQFETDQITDGSGQITETTKGKRFEYDVSGNLIKVRLPQVANPDNGNQLTSPEFRYVYDIYGNEVAQIDPNRQITIFRYNELDLQTHKYEPFALTGSVPTTASQVYAISLTGKNYELREYDALGRLVKITDFKGQVTGLFYNLLGQLEYKKFYTSAANYPDNPDKTVRYIYDGLGRKEQVIETKGATTRTTTYHYDTDGNLEQIDTPEGTIYYDSNDVTNRMESVRTANTETRYGYDALGRLGSVSAVKLNGQPIGIQTTTYNYDVVGNRSSTANEVTAAYTYDNCNRLTNLTNSHNVNGVLSSFTYDLYPDGKRHTVNEVLKYPGGNTEEHNITYTYDNCNRLTNETADTNPSGSGYSQSFVYDLVGNRKSRTVVANGQTLTTQYEYYAGTDKLHREINTGPLAWMPLGDERYYAYANGVGGINYRTPAGASVGWFSAFMLGLPTHWEQNLLIALLIAIPIMFFMPLLLSLRGRALARPRQSGLLADKSSTPSSAFCSLSSDKRSLWRQCLSVLLAYIMLLVPGLESVAQGATQYAQINTVQWASGNRTIEYQYDANGSCTQKTTKVTSAGTVLETITYDYNLRNKLEKVTKTDYSNTPDVFNEITEYTYNDEGQRVKSYYYFIVNSDPRDGEETKVFLIDSYNPTGYAQVLEETTYDSSMTFVSRMTYTIGNDVIAQSSYDGTNSTANHILYDGHGSTRQTTDDSGQITDTFGYDGYGVMLGGNPGRYSAAQTNLLYAGEYFDNNLQQYNLRARYYDTLNGRFNQPDPYAGNNYDPQSLHKYLYAHADPINRVDPSGQLAIANVMTTMAISMMIFAATAMVINPAWRQAGEQFAGSIVAELRDLAASGEAAAIAAYNAAASNTQVVKQALDDVANKLGKTVRQLQKFKFFPIFRSLTPDIFAFNVAALATHWRWFRLDYVGAGPAGDSIEISNRAIVRASWGWLMATAPPGYELDEFPYARTFQGGEGAMARPVPAWQNHLQGGYFGAFCRWTLKGRPQPFIVVPIPL